MLLRLSQAGVGNQFYNVAYANNDNTSAATWGTKMSTPELRSAILDSLSEGVFTVDHDWKITSFNRAAEEITGVPRDEALGQLCADVLHSSLCEQRCPIRAAMNSGAAMPEQRGYFVDADGERVPISLTAAVLFDADGEPLGGVESFRDRSEIEELRQQLSEKGNLSARRLESHHPAMQQLLSLVPVLAANPASVLIEGETGTGKEVLARAIHQSGPRHSKPFVAINCGALPDHLLESELFGYKKGAFTGADRDKLGRFALAGDGTLFLDEVGDVSSAMQSRLLRVLQEREFEPLGGTHAEPMQARVISASHRNLKSVVKSGDFREDLYYRLDVVRLEIPPLRERRQDVPALATQLLARSTLAMGSTVAGFTPEAMNALQTYNWPGNIRELANVIERAVVLCPGERIGVDDLPADVGVLRLPPVAGTCEASVQSAARIRQQAEAAAIVAELRKNDFNRGKTAAALGMNPSTLYRKIKAWGLT